MTNLFKTTILSLTIALFSFSYVYAESDTIGTDKLLHFAVTGTIATGLSAAFTYSDPEINKWERRTWTFVGSMIPGTMKEFGMDTEASTGDMIANATGAVFGILLGEYLATPKREMIKTEDLKLLIK